MAIDTDSYEMVANRIERILVETACVRLRESFVEFEVENFKAQNLGGADFPGIACQPRGVMCRGADDQADIFKG